MTRQSKRKPGETRGRRAGTGLHALKMTIETRNTILLSIRAGAPIEAALSFAGVSRSTFYQWLRNGAKDRAENRNTTRYAVFHRDYEEALGACEVRLSKIVSEAAKDDWKAAMTMLERKWPERWARRSVVQVKGSDSELIEAQEMDLDNLSDEELDQLGKLLEAASPR
jgi:hypothetical protein